MDVKVGLSGTGRIGRLYLRRAFSQRSPICDTVVINSTCPLPTLAHLLQYDTVHGKWEADIRIEESGLLINGARVPVISERNPEKLAWRDYGVELVIDSTGQFTDRTSLGKHLQNGAHKVLLTAPGKDMDLTIVMGVNENRYAPDHHHLLSAASCTTNCLALVLHVLDRAFGVKEGWMTAVHAYTNDQNHLDNPHKDLRRARACTSSIVPTTTGVSKALADVLPHLASHVNGLSVRVPTPDVSLLDLQVVLGKTVQSAQVKEVFEAAIKDSLGAYLAYNDLPLVSSDYIGNEKSAVVDGLSVMTRNNQVKLLAWYDNEWAYACRVFDLAQYISEADQSHRQEGDHVRLLNKR
ncbi:type I glyceraldehyde-3-phosphate dehydrogenase [Paenibacillus nasutitermitis]|uniref:Glyceraldehyde-3-phosphate dehydrogenase n=1 Tax=Paenibacillus nasutitermitis TaxID=1652958 RepID=A0A916Z6L7_9BACL|nr:type I glyceraldehyde-3-phosphate dehydrogenase [Paenibacillus nasutitermitis]GGD77405.1 glyceraldehyde-3-phosphate dehydrogenase 2 [Paenibacillus nasutitermitis]